MCDGLSTFDERDALLLVVVDGKILQLLVPGGVIVGVHVLGVIAAMDRGAAEGVTIAIRRIEAGFKELILRLLW